MADGMGGLLTLPRAAISRMTLLAAIAELGSISAAARKIGLSYKGAWDAVQALNNLFDGPLVNASAGGRAGGAAIVTPLGASILLGFQQVQEQLDAIRARIDVTAPAEMLWSLGMRTSARNALRGRIVAILEGAVSSEVVLRLADGLDIVAVVTRESVETLGLALDTPAIALIKSSFVVLAQGQGLRTSARNQIPGQVIRRTDGPVTSEIILDIGPGKTLAATITRQSAEDMGLDGGVAVTALIKAPHVLLAVE